MASADQIHDVLKASHFLLAAILGEVKNLFAGGRPQPAKDQLSEMLSRTPEEPAQESVRIDDLLSTITGLLTDIKGLLGSGAKGSGGNGAAKAAKQLTQGEAPEGAEVGADAAEAGEIAEAGTGIGAVLVAAQEIIKAAYQAFKAVLNYATTLSADLRSAGTVQGFGKLLTDMAEPIPVVGKVFKEVVGPVTQFIGNMEMANRSLAEFSPSMAAVFAQADARTALRDMRLGEATAGSAGALENAIQDLLDNTVEIRATLTTILNSVATFFTEVIQDYIVKPLTNILDFLKEYFPWFKKWLEDQEHKGDEGVSLGDWMIQVKNEVDASIRKNEGRFARPKPAFGM